jgi:cytochrome d ubiquinol oxidase subunit I
LTRDAGATSGNLWLFFAVTFVIYAAVGTATVLVLRSMQRRWRAGADLDLYVPYGPDQPVDHDVAEVAST